MSMPEETPSAPDNVDAVHQPVGLLEEKWVRMREIDDALAALGVPARQAYAAFLHVDAPFQTDDESVVTQIRTLNEEAAAIFKEVFAHIDAQEEDAKR